MQGGRYQSLSLASRKPWRNRRSTRARFSRTLSSKNIWCAAEELKTELEHEMEANEEAVVGVELEGEAKEAFELLEVASALQCEGRFSEMTREHRVALAMALAERKVAAAASASAATCAATTAHFSINGKPCSLECPSDDCRKEVQRLVAGLKEMWASAR